MGRNIGNKEYSGKLSNYAKDVLNTIITKESTYVIELHDTNIRI